MAVLRNFLYLDESALDNYLAAVEGGVHDVEQVVSRTGQEGKGSVGANLPLLNVGTAGSQSTQNEVSAQRRVVAAAKFERLINRASPDMIEIMDEQRWNELQRGEFLEAAVDLRLSKLSLTLSGIESFESLAGALSGSGGQVIPTEQLQMLGAIREILNMAFIKGIPVVCEFLPDREQKLVCFLDPQWLKVPISSLSGEVTVAVKLQRRLAPGEKFTLADPFAGLRNFPLTPEQNQELTTQIATALPDIMTDVVSPPGAVANVLAIYT